MTQMTKGDLLEKRKEEEKKQEDNNCEGGGGLAVCLWRSEGALKC